MQTTRIINWDKLAEINRLNFFFEQDFHSFKKLIENRITEVDKFSHETLNKFARLRVLEVTNGCTQFGYRRHEEECLSVEQTRTCMNLVMGFMKRKEIYFPSEGLIIFNEKEKAFMQKVQSFYKDAFKNNIQESERQYHAASTALFIVCGHQRMQKAMQLVQQDYENLFSLYYIQRGQKYIQPYLEAFA